MSSKSDYMRWWVDYGEMANEEIEYPAFQAGRAFQHSVESAELATLRAQLAEAREIIKPFIHDDLCEQLSGNTRGSESVVFGRNKAELTLGDFRAARAWYTKVTTA